MLALFFFLVFFFLLHHLDELYTFWVFSIHYFFVNTHCLQIQTIQIFKERKTVNGFHPSYIP